MYVHLCVILQRMTTFLLFTSEIINSILLAVNRSAVRLKTLSFLMWLVLFLCEFSLQYLLMLQPANIVHSKKIDENNPVCWRKGIEKSAFENWSVRLCMPWLEFDYCIMERKIKKVKKKNAEDSQGKWLEHGKVPLKSWHEFGIQKRIRQRPEAPGNMKSAFTK